MMSVLETTVLFKGRLICMVVIVFAMARTLSALNFMSAFLISALIFYTLGATKHLQTWVSILHRVKWDIGRISILDLTIRKALSTFHGFC